MEYFPTTPLCAFSVPTLALKSPAIINKSFVGTSS
jgi:hypothetical protein